jgi:transposase
MAAIRRLASQRSLCPDLHLKIRRQQTCLTQNSAALTKTFHLEMELTSTQWSLLSPVLTTARAGTVRGRPHRDVRAVANGVFWILRTGAPWADLPVRYAPHQTCHRRFREWLASGALFRCFRLLDEHLRMSTASEATLNDGTSSPPANERESNHVESGGHRRSWISDTAQLLRCSLAREALSRNKDCQDSPAQGNRST